MGVSSVVKFRVQPPAESVSDAELVVSARSGAAWAQEAIYRRHAPRLLNTAARLLHNETEARDVLQDLFIEALDSLTSLREPAALGAWLRRRLIARCTRQLQRARWKALFGIRHASEVAASSLSPMASSAEARAEFALLTKVLAALPPRARVAWTLHHADGETLVDIAALTGVSLATVKRDIAVAEAAVGRASQEIP
jgi:RNA polymerase sigma-70 factor (ECF subfamily)